MKEAVSLLVIVVILVCGIMSSRHVEESTSAIDPSTTPDALRADPAKAKALLDSAAQTYESLLAASRGADAPFHGLYPASKRWMEIEVNLAENDDQARRARTNHASRMRARLRHVEGLARSGARGGAQDSLHDAHAAAAEAEVLLVNAGGKLAE